MQAPIMTPEDAALLAEADEMAADCVHDDPDWREPRSLNILEAKRIASFPDAFQFDGSFQEQWSRIGNSVPPLLMRAIAQRLREAVGR